MSLEFQLDCRSTTALMQIDYCKSLLRMHTESEVEICNDVGASTNNDASFAWIFTIKLIFLQKQNAKYVKNS